MMTKKRKPVRADVFLDQLGNNPEYVARQAEREKQVQLKLQESRTAQEPLIRELRGAGIDVESVWDFVNTRARYPSAIPILLQHLRLSYPEVVKEGIARSLAVEEAAYAWNEIHSFYENETSQRVKQGLAAALAVTASNADLPKILELLREKRHGDSRILLLKALRRSRADDAIRAIGEFATWPEFSREIARWKRQKN